MDQLYSRCKETAQAALEPGLLLWTAEDNGGVFLGPPSDHQDTSHCYTDQRQQKRLQARQDFQASRNRGAFLG